jgi:hypothetical protein
MWRHLPVFSRKNPLYKCLSFVARMQSFTKKITASFEEQILVGNKNHVSLSLLVIPFFKITWMVSSGDTLPKLTHNF